MTKEVKTIIKKSHFYESLFGRNIYVFFNKEDLEKTLETCNYDINIDPKNSLMWISDDCRCFIAVFNNETKTLVHECVHCALRIMESIDQELTYHDEVLPYLTDFIFGECEKRYKNG